MPLTRRLILQKARSHPEGLLRIVGTWFQELFHSPPGVLFTFPSRYLSAIGHQRIFRLTGWSRQIHTRFHGPRATRETTQTVPAVSSTGVAPSLPGPSRPFDYHQHFLLPPRLVDLGRSLPQPRPRNPYQVSHVTGLASSAFARHYSRNHNCFLFLWVLRCFTSPRSLPLPYIFR